MWPNTCCSPESFITFCKCGKLTACAGTLRKARGPTPSELSGEMGRVRMRGAQGVFRGGKGNVAGLLEGRLPRRTAVTG